MENKISKVNVKFFSILFIGIVVLCVVWNVVIEEKIGTNYIFSFFFEPIVVIIPLVIFSIGFLVATVSIILESDIKRFIRTLGVSLICLSFILSISSMTVILIEKNKECNIENFELMKENYSVDNLAVMPTLKQVERSIDHGTDYFALGNDFVFHSEEYFESDESEYFSLEVSIYKFIDIPNFYISSIKKNLEEEYFHRKFRVGNLDNAKSYYGTFNGKTYTYLQSQEFEYKRRYSYFVIIVEDETQLSLLMLKSYYADGYELNVEKIIEKMCNDVR